MGLAHGEGQYDPADADFANYRITIEDSSGDLLGYQAGTVKAANSYDVDPGLGANNIFFGASSSNPLGTADFPVGTFLTNIRLSNQVTESGDAISPYQSMNNDNAPETGWRVGLTYCNVASPNEFNAADVGALLVEPPAEYYDFPSDVFASDGSYTIKAWAEDDEGTRISPLASIKLNVQESQSLDSSYQGYANRASSGSTNRRVVITRDWGNTSNDTAIRVYGLTIQDE